ncbi:MAG: sensor histidine kinase [Acidimicrobiales bacterium]
MSSVRELVTRLSGSLRMRTALAAALVVALTVVVAGGGLIWAVHRSLIDGLVTTATDTANEVATIVKAGSLPQPPPAQPGVVVQVVDAGGYVVAASSSTARDHPVSTERPAPGDTAVISTPPLVPSDDPDLTVAATVRSPSGRYTVYAITSPQQAEDSTHLLVALLAAVLVLLVVVAGAVGWALVGRALQPVESIRSEVADITARHLHRRVPQPGGADEIGRLAATMNETLARLESATERQRQFVSDASHELRSPLAALLAQLEVARAHPEAADWPAVSASVVTEGRRLSRIVEDLLLMARSDEGQLAPRRETVDLDELVLEEARRLRVQHRVAVDLHAVGAGRVVGDRDQLSRVVRNLADNAERHARSTVTFVVARHDGRVQVVVADDGPGIPPEQRHRVFERFARLDSARDRPAGGTGLGLAIVGEIVAAHGGTVVATDAAVGGRFAVTLPIGDPS